MRRIKELTKNSLCVLVIAGLLLVSLDANTVFSAAAQPELPRSTVSHELPEPSGKIIHVPSGGDLQAAINSAALGDTITLEAGASYVGAYRLPFKSGGTGTDADYITIRTDNLAGIPPSGERINPSLHRQALPKILAPGLAQKAFETAPRAHHYRFVGLEIAPRNATDDVRNLVWVWGGSGNSWETNITDQPHHIIFDRVYAHGYESSETVRAFCLNGSYMAVVNSHISEIHHPWQDSQGIGVFQGEGPYLIENNYIEASGENVMFGGADPSVPYQVPSDITVVKNHFYKPWAWREDTAGWNGYRWSVKNLFELKNAQRVLIEGNIFENSWVDGQTGVGLLFKVANQNGSCTWCVTQDVTLRNNIIRHVGSALQITNDGGMNSGIRRFNIANNLAYDISRTKYSPGTHEGNFLGLSIAADDVTISHNTAPDVDHRIGRIGDPSYEARSNLYITDNIFMRGDNGLGLETPLYEGTNAFRGWVSGGSYYSEYDLYNGVPPYGQIPYDGKWGFTGNLMFGPDMNVMTIPPKYPSGNFFTNSIDDVGFINHLEADYNLAPTSQYKGKGTSGSDPGADIRTINYATRGAVTGIWDRIVSLSPTSESFKASGGAGVVTVAALSGGDWTTESDMEWITITSGATGSGSGQVNYSVAANGAALTG